MGRTASVFLAFALALDPALTAASRQADGQIIAITFLMFGLVFLMNRKPAYAGVFMGMALLGGPSIWLGGGIALFLILWMRFRPLPGEIFQTDSQTRDAGLVGGAVKDSLFAREFLIWLAGTLIFAGTLFFIIPTGLSAALNSLRAFFEGFVSSASLAGKKSLQQVFMAFLVYEPFLIVLGIWSMLSNWYKKDPWDVFLSRWVLLALLMVSLYSGRQVTDLVWVVIPLWILSARFLTRVSWFQMEDYLLTIGQAGLIFVLLGFAWLNLLGAAGANVSDVDRQIRSLTILGTLTLILLITILVWWGWSREIALRGAGLAFIAFSMLYLVFSVWSSAGLGRAPYAELWNHSASPIDASLLVKTIGDVSMFNTGERDVMDVTVSGISSPALQWQLRDMKTVYYVESLSGEDRPSLVITPGQEKPSWGESYSGQDFVWKRAPAWSLILPQEWLRWTLFREAPMDDETIILWVRSDLMIGTDPASPALP